MPDPQSTTEVVAANPADAPISPARDRPAPGALAGNRARAGREATRQMLERGNLNDAKPSVAERPASISRPATTRDDLVGNPDEDDQATGDPPDRPTAGGLPAPEKPADPETTKRLAMLSNAEKRHKQLIAAETTKLEDRTRQLDEREATLAPRIKAADDFDALKAKARRGGAHLVEVFRALGFADTDLAPAAQTLYASSPAGAADPARKAHAEQLWQQRAALADHDATSKRVDDIEAKFEERERKLAEREQQSEFQRLQGRYLDDAVEAIGDAHPIARTVVSRAAAAAAGADKEERARANKALAKMRTKLWEITDEMSRELGEVPPEADVIARYEEIRGAELDELGVPRPTGKPAAPAKQNNQTGREQNPARTLSADLSTPRVPRDAPSGKAHRAETRAMIEAGKHTT
jgi:hypothetical protein